MMERARDVRSLGPGRFFGQTVDSRPLSGIRIAEIEYAPGLIIPRHDHELASVCLVLAGAYEERYSRHQRTARPGMIILHPEGEHHDNVHQAVPVRLLSVEIESARLRRLQESGPVLRESADYVGGEISLLGKSLLREFRCREAASALAMEALVLEILVAGCRDHERSRSKAPGWMRRAEDFLHAYFAKPLTLEAIASAAGVHPAHLARTFRLQYGYSVGDHIRRLRLEAARALVENGSVPLADIAAACGFSDQSHLTRLFRKCYGVTPAAFRRELRCAKRL